MPAFNEPRPTARIWLWTAVAVVLLSLFLAPTHNYSICVDNYRDTDLSYCESYPISFAGNQTHLLIWLAAIVATVLVGWLVARRHKAKSSS